MIHKCTWTLRERLGYICASSTFHIQHSILRNSFMVSSPFAKRCMMDVPKRDGKASLGLVPLMTKEEHLDWAEKIKPYFPHCISMYNCLVQRGRGHGSHDTFYVLHGCPSSHAVVCDKKISPTMLHIGIFCLKEEVDQLIEVLGSAPIINWRSAMIAIHHIPPYLLGPLQWLVEQNKVKMELLALVVFTYDPYLDTESLKIGTGFRLCRLGKAGVRLLTKKARFRGGIPLEMMYSLAQQVPYVGVYRDAAITQDTTVDVVNLPVAGDEEVPVAWACFNITGDVGKAMTEEGFRRCGFASLMANTVARRQAAHLGFIPHAFIAVDNFTAGEIFGKDARWSHTHINYMMSNIKLEKK